MRCDEDMIKMAEHCWPGKIRCRATSPHVTEPSRLRGLEYLSLEPLYLFLYLFFQNGYHPQVRFSTRRPLLSSHHTRHEFYETDERLTLTIFDRGADPAHVNVKFQPRRVCTKRVN
jgi:hypothetical protein